MSDAEDMVAEIETLGVRLGEAKQSITKRFIGQERVVELTLTSLLCGGHGLLIGLPGLGKTRLIETLSTVMGLHGNRIQFTPDLMPADITGTHVFNLQKNSFSLVKGPIFTTFLLADEINRTIPRTQASLLESMEERQVTVDGRTMSLPQPTRCRSTSPSWPTPTATSPSPCCAPQAT